MTGWPLFCTVVGITWLASRLFVVIDLIEGVKRK